MMDIYLIVKALHIIAAVAWFAGLFYLPRLFVYHAKNADSPNIHALFCTMERRLYKAIMWPAMLGVWGLGIVLIAQNPAIMHGAGWLHAKMFLVMVLTGYHLSLGVFLKRFSENKNTLSPRFFRIYNEIPTLFLIGIVLLAVLRPF